MNSSCQNQLQVVKTRKMKMPTKQRYYHLIINNGLLHKYDNIYKQSCLNSDLLSLWTINRVISPRHYINRTRIAFEETQLLCKQKQYLKRFYYIEEYVNKNQALTEYYKFHNEFPYHVDCSIGIIMMNHQEDHNRQQRKFLKKLMNQPASISQLSHSTHTNDSTVFKKYHNNQKQFSFKLKQLQINQSSALLEDICLILNQINFEKNYQQSFQGSYDNGVKLFKLFLLKNKFVKDNGKKLQTNTNYLKRQFIPTKIFKKKRQLQLIKKKQISSRNGNQTQQLCNTKKFDSNQQFKKTFNNMLSLQNKSKISRKNNLSKLKRNKTLNIKPQSFSKTTANDTVSKEDCLQNINKKRVKSSIRIRKCQSSVKPNLIRHKSVNKLHKISQVQNKDKQNQQKNINPNTTNENQSKQKRIFKRSNENMKSRNILKKDESKPKIQKGLTRVSSKGVFCQNPKQNNQKIQSQKSKLIRNLIKSKLKLRA